ncbi:MAG: histidine triad nucleotide-binding protein [Pseudomonadales bacterium]
MDCLFCKIVAGDIPADIIYQDDQVLAFRDISPQAPQHFLVIPKRHIATLNATEAADEPLLGHITRIAAMLAGEQGMAEDGYRVTMNCNEMGGQTVYHIHMHVLGGRQMSWPPG